jgi:hypothetical protein
VETASQIPKDQLSATMRKSLYIAEHTPPTTILDQKELIYVLANTQHSHSPSLFNQLKTITEKQNLRT